VVNAEKKKMKKAKVVKGIDKIKKADALLMQESVEKAKNVFKL
jgi:hypothetical protein